MVRKQIYIEPRQDALLKHLAQAHKISEAELIRQAIDRQLGAGLGPELPPDPDAWEKAHQFMLELHARGPIAGKGRTWNREDLYEERLSRYDRDTD
jgi:hypothetical protein